MKLSISEGNLECIMEVLYSHNIEEHLDPDWYAMMGSLFNYNGDGWFSCMDSVLGFIVHVKLFNEDGDKIHIKNSEVKIDCEMVGWDLESRQELPCTENKKIISLCVKHFRTLANQYGEAMRRRSYCEELQLYDSDGTPFGHRG